VYRFAVENATASVPGEAESDGARAAIQEAKISSLTASIARLLLVIARDAVSKNSTGANMGSL
jgi:hypothetical protein